MRGVFLDASARRTNVRTFICSMKKCCARFCSFGSQTIHDWVNLDFFTIKGIVSTVISINFNRQNAEMKFIVASKRQKSKWFPSNMRRAGWEAFVSSWISIRPCYTQRDRVAGSLATKSVFVRPNFANVDIIDWSSSLSLSLLMPESIHCWLSPSFWLQFKNELLHYYFNCLRLEMALRHASMHET